MSGARSATNLRFIYQLSVVREDLLPIGVGYAHLREEIDQTTNLLCLCQLHGVRCAGEVERSGWRGVRRRLCVKKNGGGCV